MLPRPLHSSFYSYFSYFKCYKVSKNICTDPSIKTIVSNPKCKITLLIDNKNEARINKSKCLLLPLVYHKFYYSLLIYYKIHIGSDSLTASSISAIKKNFDKFSSFNIFEKVGFKLASKIKSVLS